ncbi:titin-like [Sarcoptes scabiei]|nr:titin-like [Sarcoptes scabiei]
MAAIEDDDDENNGFNISCNAYGFYPEPEMKLFKVRSINDTLESEEVKSNTTVTSLRLSTDEFYSITLLSHIEPDLSQTKPSKSHRTYFENEEDIGGEEFMKPSRQRLLSDEQKQRFGKNSERNRQNIAEHYECRVNIPNTDYVEIKRLAIQNGWRTKWNANKGHPQSSTPSILACLVLVFLVKISLLQQSLRSFYCC